VTFRLWDLILVQTAAQKPNCTHTHLARDKQRSVIRWGGAWAGSGGGEATGGNADRRARGGDNGWAGDMDCAVVQLECPFFALDLRAQRDEASDVRRRLQSDMVDLMWRINGALQFSRAVREPAQRLMASLKELPNRHIEGVRSGDAKPKESGRGIGRDNARGQLPIGDSGYVALHVRMEDDWLEHCKTWEGDNCLTNTEVCHPCTTARRAGFAERYTPHAC
jgi:hypothetical protein